MMMMMFTRALSLMMVVKVIKVVVKYVSLTSVCVHAIVCVGGGGQKPETFFG